MRIYKVKQTCTAYGLFIATVQVRILVKYYPNFSLSDFLIEPKTLSTLPLPSMA